MFKVSLGLTVKIITGVVLVLLTSIGLMLLFLFVTSLWNNEFEKKNMMMPVIALGIFNILYYIFTQRILGYKILPEGIKIMKRNNSILIKKETIVKIKSIDYKEIRFAIRTFGIGGVFSISGTFTNKKFGIMTWYITRKDKLIMIITKNENFVISPDDDKSFLIDAQKIME